MENRRKARVEVGKQDITAELLTRGDGGLDEPNGSGHGETGVSNIRGENGQDLVVKCGGNRGAGGRLTPWGMNNCVEGGSGHWCRSK